MISCVLSKPEYLTMRLTDISADYRVKLFTELLQLVEKQAGWDQALRLLNQGQQAAQEAQLEQLATEFESGREAVLEQLKKVGQFLPWELSLIDLGLLTGNIKEIFTRVRSHYLVQQQFIVEFKRLLKLPLLVLVIALVIVLVWAGHQNNIAVLSMIIRLSVSLGVTYLLIYGVSHLCLRYRKGLCSVGCLWFLHKMPVIKPLLLSQQRYHFLKNIQQCTDSGIALVPALKLSAEKIPDPFFTPRFLSVHQAVNNGVKLSVALVECEIIKGLSIAPLSNTRANANDAQKCLSDAAFQNYFEQLWRAADLLSQMMYVLLPILACVNLATM